MGHLVGGPYSEEEVVVGLMPICWVKTITG